MRIDLNSDLGESFGAYRIGADEDLFDVISSANVACGFHGGDPLTLERTVARASAAGVRIGAHPGFRDLVGFGRRVIAATPDEIRTDTLYQIGALDAFCRAAGVRLQHVKAHGALNNVAVSDREVADAIVAATKAYDPTLIMLTQPGALYDAAVEAGLPVAAEAFADRAYHANGHLVSRKRPDALITDPREAAERMVRLVTTGKLATVDGTDYEIEAKSICVHSDTPGAGTIMRAVRDALEQAGVTIAPLASA